MRRRLKFNFVGTLLLMSNVAHAFILLTASMDDVKRIAKKFVSESLADKIADVLARASEQMNTNVSEENEQNEDEFENISNELISNYNPSKQLGRQRFETKSQREENDELIVTTTDTTDFDRSNTFMEWDAEQMNEVAKEEKQHNVDFDKPKPHFHDEDRLIDEEFKKKDKDIKKKAKKKRGNERLNKNNKGGQDNTDHKLKNVRFNHKYKVNQHKSEKPKKDFDLKFNELSKEESKEANQSDNESKGYIDPKKDIGHKRKIVPTEHIIEKPDDNQSQISDEKNISEENSVEDTKLRKILRQGTEPTTSEKSRDIQFKPSTKKKLAISSKPKRKTPIVKRLHHRLAESNEIKEDALNMPGNEVPFLKTIDDREYDENVERRGNLYMKNLLATSGPISLPKISNKHKDTIPAETKSWI